MHIRNRNGSKSCSSNDTTKETMDTNDHQKNRAWTYTTAYSQDTKCDQFPSIYTMDSSHSTTKTADIKKQTTFLKTPDVDTGTGSHHRLPLKTQLRMLGSEFSSHTTAHGWGRVAGAHSRTVKIIWLTVTIFALTASGIHVSLLLAHYLSFRSEVKWQVSVAKISFPSVSVCNIQPMSPTTAEELLMDPNSNFYRWYNATQNLQEAKDYLEDIDRLKEYETFESRLQQPIGYYENIGAEAQVVGHAAMDFILGCTFSQNRCSHELNFTLFQSAQYFNCYTFNGGGGGGEHKGEELVSTMSGPHEGLSLVLYLENDNGTVYILFNYFLFVFFLNLINCFFFKDQNT